MDRHRFDADPDPTFYFDADPVPDPSSIYTQVRKSEIVFDFSSQHCFIFLISIIDDIIFNIWAAF